MSKEVKRQREFVKEGSFVLRTTHVRMRRLNVKVYVKIKRQVKRRPVRKLRELAYKRRGPHY